MDRARKKRYLVWLAAVLCALFGAALLWSFLLGRFTIEDSFGDRLEAYTVDGVLVFTIVGEPTQDERISHRELWVAEIKSVAFDRPPKLNAASPTMRIDDTMPTPGTRRLISIEKFLEITPGGEYAAMVSRPPAQGGTEPSPWRARVVLDAANGFAPVAGTRESIAQDIEWITLEGESPLDALVAWSTEYATVLDARATSLDDPPAGARQQMLRDAELALQSDDIATVFAAATPEVRQLPGEMDAPPEVAAKVASAIGVEAWTPWSIIFRYDAAVVAEHPAVGLMIEGIGFIGPTLLDPEDSVVTLNGFGPPHGSTWVIGWTTDRPAELAVFVGSPPDVGATWSEALDNTQLGIDAAARELLNRGGAILHDLRDGGQMAVVVSAADARSLLTELVGPSKPQSETDIAADVDR